MWYFIKHYASALLTRSNILLEIKKAQKNKLSLPKNLSLRAWKQPHIHEEYIWFLRFINPNEEVQLIDIGANTGYWSELFLEYYPKTKILGFEPVPETFNKNKERYKDNRKVKIYNVGLGAEKEEKSINVAKGLGLTSFLVYDDLISSRNDHFERKEIVKVDQLNNYINDIDAKNRKVICKIDIQGFEVEAVKGATEALGLIDAMIIECSFVQEFKAHMPTFPQLCSILINYDLYPVQFGVYDYSKGPFGWERNVLFIKSKYLKDTWGY